MSRRTARTFYAMLSAIILTFVADGIIILYSNFSAITSSISYPISFRHATTIALDHEPDAQAIGEPTLISFAGSPAYEVKLDRGIVYIEASTGRVLGDTARGPSSCLQSASSAAAAATDALHYP